MLGVPCIESVEVIYNDLISLQSIDCLHTASTDSCTVERVTRPQPGGFFPEFHCRVWLGFAEVSAVCPLWCHCTVELRDYGTMSNEQIHLVEST